MLKELFSIPNLIGYFRVLMLPVFLVNYNRAETAAEFAAVFLLLAVIFLSDALDGYIARKYDMVTNFGKILDPVTDKLVQGTLALAVALRHPRMWVFLVVFLLKEAYMGIMGLYLMRVKKALNGAQWYGKICTAAVDAGVLLLLFGPGMPEAASNGILAVMIAVELFSAGMYLKFHIGILRKKRQTESEEKR